MQRETMARAAHALRGKRGLLLQLGRVLGAGRRGQALGGIAAAEKDGEHGAAGCGGRVRLHLRSDAKSSATLAKREPPFNDSPKEELLAVAVRARRCSY